MCVCVRQGLLFLNNLKIICRSFAFKSCVWHCSGWKWSKKHPTYGAFPFKRCPDTHIWILCVRFYHFETRASHSFSCNRLVNKNRHKMEREKIIQTERNGIVKSEHHKWDRIRKHWHTYSFAFFCILCAALSLFLTHFRSIFCNHFVDIVVNTIGIKI